MTISITPNRVEYTGNAVTTYFPFSFQVFQAGYLEVYVDGVLQALNVDYTVSLTPNSGEGGGVTFTTAPTSGADIVLIRALPKTQLIDYPPEQKTSAALTELSLDYLTCLLQDVTETIGRVFTLPAYVAYSGSLVLPTPEANKYLAWAPDGLSLVNATAGSSIPDGDKGDIVVSGSGTSWVVDSKAISFSKMQDIATGVILGRSTALTGSIETISIGSGLQLSAGVLASTITQYTDELAQDAVLGNITAGNGVTFTYNDAGNTAAIALTYGSLANTVCQGNDSRLSDTRTPTDNTVTTVKLVDDNVTFDKVQNVSTSVILGRVSGGSGNIEALTGTQVTTLLDVFTTSLKGLVPASGGGTTNFLRADGSWAAPPGGGGGVSDGDKGDITVASSGAVWTIDNDVVTFAKMQNIATGVLLGRSTASSGDIETLSVGTGLQLSSGTLSCTITQYTDELAQDAVMGNITAGNGVTFTYNDAGNTATIALTYGSLANTVCQGNDSRLSDTRTPTDNTVSTVKIVDNNVTLAKLVDIATASFLGRTTSGTGDPEVLTTAQATALLNTFTSLLKGLVPASGGGTTNFLRADGTWAAPSGGGGGTDYGLLYAVNLFTVR